MVEPPDIHLPPLVGAQSDSWAALLGIAPSLGPNWLLVGGQMVLLHEVERRAVQTRPTDDVDVVVDLRVAPSGLATVRDALTGGGFTQDGPDPDGVAHRFRRGRATIDVLAPDHLGSRANLAIGSGRTIEAPGTLRRFTAASGALSISQMEAHRLPSADQRSSVPSSPSLPPL